MPDKKLTDSEIIKAFECCLIKDECDECPIKNKTVKRCNNLLELTLDLLNRLQAENERLKEKSIEDDKILNERVIESVNAVSKAHLKYENALEEQLKTAKAEVYKEFAEKAIKLIKAKAFNLQLMRSLYTSQSAKALNKVAEDIDNLLKELVGDTDV